MPTGLLPHPCPLQSSPVSWGPSFVLAWPQSIQVPEFQVFQASRWPWWQKLLSVVPCHRSPRGTWLLCVCHLFPTTADVTSSFSSPSSVPFRKPLAPLSPCVVTDTQWCWLLEHAPKQQSQGASSPPAAPVSFRGVLCPPSPPRLGPGAQPGWRAWSGNRSGQVADT